MSLRKSDFADNKRKFASVGRERPQRLKDEKMFKDCSLNLQTSSRKHLNSDLQLGKPSKPILPKILTNKQASIVPRIKQSKSKKLRKNSRS